MPCWDCAEPLKLRRWFLGRRSVWWCSHCAEMKEGLRLVLRAT